MVRVSLEYFYEISVVANAYALGYFGERHISIDQEMYCFLSTLEVDEVYRRARYCITAFYAAFSVRNDGRFYVPFAKTDKLSLVADGRKLCCLSWRTDCRSLFLVGAIIFSLWCLGGVFYS